MNQRTLDTIAEAETPTFTTDRLGAWAGLAFTATFIAWLVIAVGNGPRFGAPLSEARQFLEDNVASLRTASFIIGVGLLFFLLPFVASLTNLTERSGGAGSWLTRVTMAGAVMSITVYLMVLTLTNAVVLVGVETLSDAALEALWNAEAVLVVFLFHLTTGLWVAAAAVAILQSSALPRWLGWLGIGLLAAQILASTWLLSAEVNKIHDAVAGIGQIGAFLIWIPAVAISMLRRSGSPERAVTSNAT